jgi:hypothetical protein
LTARAKRREPAAAATIDLLLLCSLSERSERKEDVSFCGGNRLAQRAQKEPAAAATIDLFLLCERSKRQRRANDPLLLGSRKGELAAAARQRPPSFELAKRKTGGSGAPTTPFF